ncbi:MAG: aldehyde dehydrogenase family protein [Myxococcota bacterium]
MNGNVDVTPELRGAELYAGQKAFFDAGHTRPRAFREAQLRTLHRLIRDHSDAFERALHEDLGKCQFEAQTSEILFTLGEIDCALANLASWMAPEGHIPPMATWPSRARIHPQPLGPTLMISPWNYPMRLALSPLVACIAAGNTGVIKPSELAPATSELVAKLINDNFAPEYLAAVEGSVPEAQDLLAQPWAHFFYTGGPSVGRIVAHAAADHLARVTLELGGKSPVVVTRSANLPIAAKRIVHGKFLNAGQTCVAPDYLLVERPVHADLMRLIGETVTSFFGHDPQRSPDFGRIVTTRHHRRLAAMIDPEKAIIGGTVDEADKYIAPTVLDGASWDDASMQEEIFGPILPVIVVESFDDAVQQIGRSPDPLAAYLFTEESAEADAFVDRVSFGGGCVNNTMLHMIDHELPFGGVGASGQGAYHGRFGFERFSHHKSVVASSTLAVADLPVKYPPYGSKLKVARWFVG